jgi:hypothetical protein
MEKEHRGIRMKKAMKLKNGRRPSNSGPPSASSGWLMGISPEAFATEAAKCFDHCLVVSPEERIAFGNKLEAYLRDEDDEPTKHSFQALNGLGCKPEILIEAIRRYCAPYGSEDSEDFENLKSSLAENRARLEKAIEHLNAAANELSLVYPDGLLRQCGGNSFIAELREKAGCLQGLREKIRPYCYLKGDGNNLITLLDLMSYVEYATGERHPTLVARIVEAGFNAYKGKRSFDYHDLKARVSRTKTFYEDCNVIFLPEVPTQN